MNNCNEKSAKVTWAAPQTNFTITGYAYQYKKATDEDWSSEVTTTTDFVTLSNLTADTDYQFRVKALYSSSYSAFAKFNFITATPLPHEQGFENDMGRWRMVDCNIDWLAGVDYPTYTGIRTLAKHDGDLGFMFSSYPPGTGIHQYLISPRFSNDVAKEMSFYYQSPNGAEVTFEVGWSNTTDDINNFEWSGWITTSNQNWTQYKRILHATNKYFAIRYISSNVSRLYLDDFCIEEFSSYARPLNLTVSNLMETQATLSWEPPSSSPTGYAFQYKKTKDAEWSAESNVTSTSVILSNLSPNTSYDFRVKACYTNGHVSNYVTVRFMTEGPIESLPHTQNFEDGMGGWRIVDGWGRTGTSTRYKHDGEYSFEFDEGSDSYQYLMSPQLDANTAMKMTFWYENYNNGTKNFPATFEVGYSTTTKSPNAFTWGAIMTSSSEWQQHTELFPAGTKYVAIKWIDGYWLYIDDISITKLENINIADNAGNTAVITTNNGKEAQVSLQGHTLYRNGDWNTLCLPFAMAQLRNTPLDHATVKKLSSATQSGGTLTLNFEDATSIEAGKPYLVKWKAAYLTIKTEADWNAFAESVAGGKSYEGKTVLLDADISISTMVGTKEHPFNGIFDGNGFMITANISKTGEGTAPFNYINGATIRGLHVVGTIVGGNYSSGLVGIASGGTNAILNSLVETKVSTSGKYVAGILGHGTSSSTTISDCLFGGSLPDNGKNIGAIYGCGDSMGTHIIENCLADGEYATTPLSLVLMLASGDNCSIINCYRNFNATQPQGTYQIFDNDLEGLQEALGENWILDSNGLASTYYHDYNIHSYPDITDPVFLGVISNATANVITPNVEFIGITSPKTLMAGDKTVFYLNDYNTFCHPSANVTIGSCRAYIHLPNGLGNTSIGDVNDDGAVTISDVARLVNYVLTNGNDNIILANADSNGDGQITVTDVAMLVSRILNNTQSISKVVINTGDDTITFGGAGNGPFRLKNEY